MEQYDIPLLEGRATFATPALFTSIFGKNRRFGWNIEILNKMFMKNQHK